MYMGIDPGVWWVLDKYSVNQDMPQCRGCFGEVEFLLGIYSETFSIAPEMFQKFWCTEKVF